MDPMGFVLFVLLVCCVRLFFNSANTWGRREMGGGRMRRFGGKFLGGAEKRLRGAW